MDIQRLKEKYADNKAIPIHDFKDSFLVEEIMALLAYIESLEKKAKAYDEYIGDINLNVNK